MSQPAPKRLRQSACRLSSMSRQLMEATPSQQDYSDHGISTSHILLTQILILIINMCQTLPELTEAQTETLHHVRSNHVTTFFQIKEKVKILTRQTLFLGIAICDKFFEKTSEAVHSLVDLESNRELRTLSCIWIAWKFIETDKIPIKKLIQKVQFATITSQEVIEMEFQILERIGFEIPTSTTYASMTKEFQSLQTDRRSQVVIASQCLKFLQEALKYSSDFSLCEELGPKILRLYRERSVQDRRIRSVYMQIQGQRSDQAVNGVKVR